MTLSRVQPITPTWRKEPFDDFDWLFDFKYDGFRALYYIEPGHNRLISRNGNLLTRFDVLAGALAAELNVDDAIIDGEVIAADETGRPQFYDLLGLLLVDPPIGWRGQERLIRVELRGSSRFRKRLLSARWSHWAFSA